METFSFAGTTVNTMIDTRRKTSDNLYPVKIRVTFQRERLYFPLNIYLSEEDWSVIDTSKKRSLIDKRELIHTLFTKIEERVKELATVDDFSLEGLKKAMSKNKSVFLRDAFLGKITELTKNERISTAELHTYAMNSLLLFGGDQIKLTDITVEFLHNYAKWLYKKGRSRTTVSMYCRNLQSVFNIAIADGSIKQSTYPFGSGKFEIPDPEDRKLALKLSDIKKIFEYTTVNPVVEMSRDMWLFAYLCNGANITDILKLKKENIRNGEICFYRAKTVNRSKKPKLVQAPLTDELSTIISKHGTLKAGEYIFPVLSHNLSAVEERNTIKNFTKLVNQKMRIVCKDLNIEKVTTYNARHSFATVLKRSGVSISFISDQLGHTDMKTTEHYLANFEDEERRKNSMLLTAF